MSNMFQEILKPSPQDGSLCHQASASLAIQPSSHSSYLFIKVHTRSLYSSYKILEFTQAPLRATNNTCWAFVQMHGQVTQDDCSLVLSASSVQPNMVHWRREWETTSKPLQHSCLENSMKSMKSQKFKTLEDELPRSVGAQYATGKEKRNSSRRNEEGELKQKTTQLWMWLVMEVKSDAVKNNIADEPGMLAPWIKVNWK